MSGTTYTTAQLKTLAAADAAKYGVPTDIFLDQINAESSWNPNAVSPTGATGLGQFTQATAADYGLTNRADPAANLDAAAHYDADLYKQYGTWDSALSHYSANGYTATSLLSQNGQNVADASGGLTSAPAGFTTDYQPGYTAVGYTDADGTTHVGYAPPNTGSGTGTGLTGTSDPTGTTSTSTSPTGTTGSGTTTGAPTAATQSALAGSWASFIQEWGLRILFVLLGIIVVGAGLFWLAHGGSEKLQKQVNAPAAA